MARYSCLRSIRPSLASYSSSLIVMQHVTRGLQCFLTRRLSSACHGIHLNWNNHVVDCLSTLVNLGSSDGGVPHGATPLRRDASTSFPSKDINAKYY